MNRDRVLRWAQRFRSMFEMLEEMPSQLDHWQMLIHQFDIKGFQVHDAKYAALMISHGITKFMTHNVKHFRNFPITVIDPTLV